MTWTANKIYRTRGGGKARVYATDGGGQWPIHGAWYNDIFNSWTVSEWSVDGYVLARSGVESDEDLTEHEYREPDTAEKILVEWLELSKEAIRPHSDRRPLGEIHDQLGELMTRAERILGEE